MWLYIWEAERSHIPKPTFTIVSPKRETASLSVSAQCRKSAVINARTDIHSEGRTRRQAGRRVNREARESELVDTCGGRRLKQEDREERLTAEDLLGDDTTVLLLKNTTRWEFSPGPESEPAETRRERTGEDKQEVSDISRGKSLTEAQQSFLGHSDTNTHTHTCMHSQACAYIHTRWCKRHSGDITTVTQRTCALSGLNLVRFEKSIISRPARRQCSFRQVVQKCVWFFFLDSRGGRSAKVRPRAWDCASPGSNEEKTQLMKVLLARKRGSSLNLYDVNHLMENLIGGSSIEGGTTAESNIQSFKLCSGTLGVSLFLQ